MSLVENFERFFCVWILQYVTICNNLSPNSQLLGFVKAGTCENDRDAENALQCFLWKRQSHQDGLTRKRETFFLEGCGAWRKNDMKKKEIEMKKQLSLPIS